MTDKIARIINQPSNRAKPKDAREKKTVFKPVLDNPHRIHWPSVPLNLQNAILAKILQLLDGTSEYQLQRFSESRKRKRREKNSESKRQKLEFGSQSSSRSRMDEDDPPVEEKFSESEKHTLQMDESQSGAQNRMVEDVPPHSENSRVLESPALFRHLVYGINEVTKRLENQTQAVRRPVITILPEDTKAAFPTLQSVFVCRSDMNSSLVIDHLPHLIAAYNSCRPTSFVSLVPLPKGAEQSLAQALGIRRVAVFGISTLYQHDPSFKSLLDKVPILTASWLSQADTSHTLIPTHVKQLRTTAPKDMKVAKELRNKERVQARQRKRMKLKARGEKDSITKSLARDL